MRAKVIRALTITFAVILILSWCCIDSMPYVMFFVSALCLGWIGLIFTATEYTEKKKESKRNEWKS